MRQVLDEAAKGGYGVGAFNVNNMEQIQAIMEAARETKSPVIVQASRGARAYANDKFLYHLMLAAAELYPEIPMVMHQDHGNSLETCISAIDAGLHQRHDGRLARCTTARRPSTYRVQRARSPARWSKCAHAKGVTVEGEIGVLGGIEDGHGAGGTRPGARDRSRPGRASSSKTTGVDALAVAIGTSHGAYKFTKQARRRSAQDGSLIEDPQEAAQRAPGHARLFERAAGAAGDHQPSTAAR